MKYLDSFAELCVNSAKLCEMNEIISNLQQLFCVIFVK
jgi:hypothetical protein